MPYRPRYRPSAADPLTEAISGLREGWRGAAEERRQRQLDEERREDRQRAYDMQRRATEAQEFRTFGQMPTAGPPTIDETVDVGGLHADLAAETRRQFAERRSTPQPATAGAYVPGQGFALPQPQVMLADSQARGGQVRAPSLSDVTLTREAPDAVQIGEDRWIRRSLLPEEQERVRQAELEEEERQREAERMERLHQALSGLGHVSEESAAAIAAGVPASVALPPEPTVGQHRPVNWQRFTGNDGMLYTQNPQTRQVEPVLGPDGEHLSDPSAVRRSDGVTATSRYGQEASAARAYLTEIGRIDHWWRTLEDWEREKLGGEDFLQKEHERASYVHGFSSPSDARTIIRGDHLPSPDEEVTGVASGAEGASPADSTGAEVDLDAINRRAGRFLGAGLTPGEVRGIIRDELLDQGHTAHEADAAVSAIRTGSPPEPPGVTATVPPDSAGVGIDPDAIDERIDKFLDAGLTPGEVSGIIRDELLEQGHTLEEIDAALRGETGA